MVRATSPQTPTASDASSSPNPNSEKRAAANRANARNSTGPRTAEGKARSRLNALKHGLCARTVLLPGELHEEYETFALRIIDDLHPDGAVEQMLAERVASLAWALNRLPGVALDLVDRGEEQRYDRWALRRGLGMPGAGDPPPEPLEGEQIIADALSNGAAFMNLLRMQEHERRLWAAMLSTIRALELRQKIAAADDKAAKEKEPQRDTGCQPVRETSDRAKSENGEQARGLNEKTRAGAERTQSRSHDPHLPAKNALPPTAIAKLKSAIDPPERDPFPRMANP